jgi:hypothetical protein
MNKLIQRGLQAGVFSTPQVEKRTDTMSASSRLILQPGNKNQTSFYQSQVLWVPLRLQYGTLPPVAPH